MDETRLFERLRKIEALFARAGSDGERVAAANALERILERMRELEEADPPVEYKFTMPDMWSRRVFVALLRRYGLQPYRYHRQRYTTVMVRVSKGFVDETLWPEFQAFDNTLREHLNEVTVRIVDEVIEADGSDAPVVTTPPLLPSRIEATGEGSPKVDAREESAPSPDAASNNSGGRSSGGRSSGGSRQKKKKSKRKSTRKR